MIIYPALDLIDGRCVRLARGAFDNVTDYDISPKEILGRYSSNGACWAHIVDLDGAREGAPRQHQLICDLAEQASLKIQAAGGIREQAQVARLIAAGVGRVVVGSLATTKPELITTWIKQFGPEALTLAFDVRLIEGEPLIATHGWQTQSEISLWSALDAIGDVGLRHVLVTDIARDGMLSGPNLDLIKEIRRRRPDIALQASGGIRALSDISDLCAAGAAGVVIGKAFLEGVLSLKDAINVSA